MPAMRIVAFRGTVWRLSDLARAHGLKPQTLASRLDRGLPPETAVTMRLCSRSEAGRRSAYVASRWRD